MKKRSFVIFGMAMVRDTEAPEADEDFLVTKKDETVIEVPICIQNFKNKEAFIEEITNRASRLWDLHEHIIEENANPKVEKEPTFKDMN